MSNYWKRKADRMFGPMPRHDEEEGDFRISFETAMYSVEQLRIGNIDSQRATGYLADIDDYLGDPEYRMRRLRRLTISEDQLSEWKKQYGY